MCSLIIVCISIHFQLQTHFRIDTQQQARQVKECKELNLRCMQRQTTSEDKKTLAFLRTSLEFSQERLDIRIGKQCREILLIATGADLPLRTWCVIDHFPTHRSLTWRGG